MCVQSDCKINVFIQDDVSEYYIQDISHKILQMLKDIIEALTVAF